MAYIDTRTTKSGGTTWRGGYYDHGRLRRTPTLRAAEGAAEMQALIERHGPDTALAILAQRSGHATTTPTVVVELEGCVADLAARATLFDFRQTLAEPLWTAGPEDSDRFLAELRRAGRAARTRAAKAGALAQFHDFAIARYQADVHALTKFVPEQPADEFNRQSGNPLGPIRVPPSDAQAEALFAGWRSSLSRTRKLLPAARDYVAASLWRRLGLRIMESAKFHIRDWRPDLGESGKLHVRFGKGSRGRGAQPRLVRAINGRDRLTDWWLAEVRHLFGPDWEDPDAPMCPPERFDAELGRCQRTSDDVLRQDLTAQTAAFLSAGEADDPARSTALLRGVARWGGYGDLKAIQEVLGHEWLSTTTRCIHVSSDHVEQAWMSANRRLETRFGGRV